MFDQGWISLHRKMTEWEWYDDSKIVHLYIHCLIKSNHKAKKWRGVVIEPGQFITSYQKLSEQLPLSVRQIRTALNKLKSTGELTIKSTSKYSMISVTNWVEYQTNDKQTGKQATSKRQSNDNQMTTNNNENNDNNKTNKQNDVPLWLDKSAWNEFEQHRRDIKKPLTDLSRKKNLKILEDNKNDQREIIDKTIANRWTGLFPIKLNDKGKPQETDDYNHYRKKGSEINIHPGATESDKDYIQRVKNAIS